MKVNTPFIQAFLHGAIKLHESLILFTVLYSYICDETNVWAELNRIKKLIAWNGFPKWIGRTLIAKKLNNFNTATNKNQLTSENNKNVDVFWINLPYLSTQGDQLLLSTKRMCTIRRTCYRQWQFSLQPDIWLCELPIYKKRIWYRKWVIWCIHAWIWKHKYCWFSEKLEYIN